MNKFREDQIINFVLTKANNETLNENNYYFFIINLINKSKKEQDIKPRVFDRNYVDNLNKQEELDSGISDSELYNAIFDYFIIHKQKEKL